MENFSDDQLPLMSDEAQKTSNEISDEYTIQLKDNVMKMGDELLLLAFESTFDQLNGEMNPKKEKRNFYQIYERY